jgi:hypothetical protein
MMLESCRAVYSLTLSGSRRGLSRRGLKPDGRA